ncbi:MAG: response regulator, partial [Candidatus Omnitrophota bacterium]
MPKKILIIDDEPDLMKIAVTRISKAGYTVLQAGDGKAGLAMVESEKPDLVLLDLAMPVMDGYEVCLRIKGSEASQHIPVVLFT